MASGHSILDILPLEIVELVILESHNHNRKDFCDLRLVCKALNELVEPRAFSIVTIRFERDDLGKWRAIPEFLSSLASGTSPYVRWAKELRLGALVPIQFETQDIWARYEPWQGEERETMLACQKEWLTPAIEVLDQVERVNFAGTIRGPYREVLCSLARLPRLRDLSVDFPSQFAEVSFAGFSNLNSIRFSNLPMTAQILNDLKGLLTRSPSITQLVLNASSGYYNGPVVNILNFRSLVEDAMRPDFSPTLKELTVTAARISLSPSTAPFLRSLTSLNICFADVQPSFWKNLQAIGISLQKLVAPLCQSAIDYLLSYSGLREFGLDLGRVPQTKELEKIIPQFFLSVLPKHRQSIQSITFKHIRSGLGLWAITQSYLDQGVYLCEKLKCLTLSYYFPGIGEERTREVLPLGNLFSDISNNLPHLRTLRLEHTRNFRTAFGCGYARGQYHQGVIREFSAHIVSSESTFEAKEQPQFSLEAAGTTFTCGPTNAGPSGSKRNSRSGSRQYYRFDPPLQVPWFYYK